MAHLFVLLDSVEKRKNFDKPSKIVRNATKGPFVIDEDGRQINPNEVAAIDSDCKICAKGIESGALTVLREVTSSSSSSKPKSKEKTEVVSAPVAEVVEQEVQQVQETVAPTSQE